MNARPKPNPVRLPLKQRRALSICEYYSAKLRREVIVPARTYWLALWLDWARDVTAYVELPANPDSPNEWLADFWIECAGKEYLLNVPAGEGRPDSAASANPWSLVEDGFEPAEEGPSQITPRWLWARRSLLLALEQAHPYAVAASRQGGLKLTCKKLLADWPEQGASIGSVCARPGANGYVLQCALFHLVRTGKLRVDWTRGLSLNSILYKVEHAPQS